MREVVLVGTSHKFQCLGGGAGPESIELFQQLILSVCLEHRAKAVAEEMSEAGIKERGASETVAQRLCAEMGLKHQLSDPSPELRKQLGISGENDIRRDGHFKYFWDEGRIEAEVRNDHEKRERYWFEQLCVLNVWPAVFVCGAKHCDSFEALLRANGIAVVVACKDWSPSA